VGKFRGGRTSVVDVGNSGRSSTVTRDEVKEQIHQRIRDSRRISSDEISS